MIPFDLINGLFEIGGAVATCLNVRSLMRDKEVKGVDWRMFVFYVGWGLFNLIYYPHLGQWLSFAGGCCIVAANACWLALALAYKGASNGTR